MSSGVGLSRSLPAFYVENALVHICRCDRRVGDRGSMLLARLSSAVAEASVAERTLTPADRTAGPEKATETSQANVRTDACSPADPGRVDDAGALAPDGAAPRTRGRPDCPNRAEVDGPSSGLPAANVRTAMADRPGISASRNERPSTSTASTAPVGPVWRAPIKRAQAVVPTAPRYGSYAAAGYQPWYSARQRGSYGLQSKYGSYTNQQYQ